MEHNCSARCCAFVRPVAEYGSVLMMGASATQLSKFDRMRDKPKLSPPSPSTLKLVADNPISACSIVLRNQSCNSKSNGNQNEIPV